MLCWVPKQDLTQGATQDCTYMILGEDMCLVDEGMHALLGACENMLGV